MCRGAQGSEPGPWSREVGCSGESLCELRCVGPGGSGQGPASILKCSQPGPQGAILARVSVPSRPCLSRSSVLAVASVQRQDLGPLVRASPSAPHTLQAQGGFMQEAAPGVPGERRQRFEA